MDNNYEPYWAGTGCVNCDTALDEQNMCSVCDTEFPCCIDGNC